MREAYGGVWLFIIVIFFLSVFSSFLALSVNYSRAFKVKDEIVGIIERRKGLETVFGNSTGAISEIKDYMANVGYRTKGVCDPGFNGYNLNSGESTTNNGPVFCLKEFDASSSATHSGKNSFNRKNEFLRAKYYKVQVFFRLDIPIFDQIFGFSIYGTTKTLYITSR